MVNITSHIIMTDMHPMIKKVNGYSYPRVWTHTPAVVSQSSMKQYPTMNLLARILIDQVRRDGIHIQGVPHGMVIIRIPEKKVCYFIHPTVLFLAPVGFHYAV